MRQTRPELWVAPSKQFCLQPSLECRQWWRRSDIGRQTVPYTGRSHRKRTVTVTTTTTYSFCFSSLFFLRLFLCRSCHLTRSVTVVKNDLCISFICRSEARLHTDRRFRQESFPCRPAFDWSEIGIEWDSGHSQICNHDAAQSSGKALSWWPIFFEGV